MKTGARVGMAAFVVGLSLACPQVAVADSGDNSASTEAAGQTGSARAGSPGEDNAAQGSHASRGGAGGAAESVTLPEVAIDHLEPEIVELPEVLELPDVAIEPEVAVDPVGPDVTTEPDFSVDPGEPDVTAEPQIAVDPVPIDLVESEDTVEPEVTVEPDVAVDPLVLDGTLESLDPADAQADGTSTDESVTEVPEASTDTGDPEIVAWPVVVLPGRGGPNPMPWWRSANGTDDGATDESADPSLTELEDIPSDFTDPVWAYSGAVDPSVTDPSMMYTMTADDGDSPDPIPTLYTTTDTKPNPVAGPTASGPDQYLAAARARIAKFFDGISAWLSTLPANPFTEFLSGVLLLVRRGLVPLDVPITSMTADRGNRSQVV